MAGEVKYEKDLEWKNHNLFFEHLNKNLLKISEIAEKCLIDMEMLNEYYCILNISFNRYYIYFDDDSKEFLLKLEKSQKLLYSHDYINSVVNYTKIKSNDKKQEFRKLQLENYNVLNEVFRYLVKQLVDNELLPKIKQKAKKDPRNAMRDTEY